MKKILIYGPQGSGKTSYAWNIASMHYNKDKILGINYAHWRNLDHSILRTFKVLIIDEYPECAKLPFDLDNLAGLDFVIVCVQRDKDYRFPQPDVAYIKMPNCIELSLERIALISLQDLVGTIRKDQTRQEYYSRMVMVTEDTGNDDHIEYAIVATRRPKPKNEEA